MILRFRIEVENVSRELAEEELAEWSTKFMHQVALEHADDLCGKWECTDDVVSKIQDKADSYRGRMVLKFHLLGNEHVWQETETMKWCKACGKAVQKNWGGYPVRQEAKGA